MRTTYTFCLALILGCLNSLLFAQTNSDSLSASNQTEIKKERKWRRSDWIVPSSLIITGAVVSANKGANEYFFNNHEVREERNAHFKNFRTHADNFLQYGPAVAVFGLNLAGVKGKNDLANQTAILIKSELLMTAIVFPTKILVGERRPDTGAKNSFPSGHTAQAFTAATFLAKEYGHKSIWYPITAYTMATSVAVCRVLNNRHWLSDVITGAGVGILSTNLVYLTHQHKWGKNKALTKNKSELSVTPTYNSRNIGVYLSYKF